MVDISQLRKDMKSHLTIEEVCEKHKITFKEAVRLLSKSLPRKPKERPYKYHSTGEKYISFYHNKYHVRRTINGNFKSYGSYNSLDDAILMRDYLIEHGWYQNRVKSIRKKLGV